MTLLRKFWSALLATRDRQRTEWHPISPTGLQAKTYAAQGSSCPPFFMRRVVNGEVECREPTPEEIEADGRSILAAADRFPGL